MNKLTEYNKTKHTLTQAITQHAQSKKELKHEVLKNLVLAFNRSYTLYDYKLLRYFY